MRAVDNALLMFVVSVAAFIIDDHKSPGVSWDKTPMSVSRQLSTGSEKTFLSVRGDPVVVWILVSDLYVCRFQSLRECCWLRLVRPELE